MNGTGETPTVFVVDDDGDLRESLSWLVEEAGIPVKTYESAEEFLADYEPENVGCLVLDVRLPGRSGLDLQEELRRRGGAPPAIILTAYARLPSAVRAFKGGAVDFLRKPFDPDELLTRIRGALQLDRRTHETRVSSTRFTTLRASLTPREQQVMELLVTGKPNKIIAADLGISPKTVEIHRGRVMDKMQVDSVAELVRLSVLASKPSGES